MGMAFKYFCNNQARFDLALSNLVSVPTCEHSNQIAHFCAEFILNTERKNYVSDNVNRCFPSGADTGGGDG